MKYDRIVEINKEKCQQNMMLVQKEINMQIVEIDLIKIENLSIDIWLFYIIIFLTHLKKTNTFEK